MPVSLKKKRQQWQQGPHLSWRRSDPNGRPEAEFDRKLALEVINPRSNLAGAEKSSL